MDLEPIALSVPSRQLSDITEQVERAVSATIQSGWWLRGPQTSAFEEEFAAYCTVERCLAVGNGTDGLELALRALGTTGREVITVANAGGYTTTACRLVGAIPVYVDVEPEHLTMDIDAALRAVTADTGAIVATHLYGNVVNVAALKSGLERMNRSNVPVVEDGSQAHGAQLHGEMVGSLGDVAVFSFYPTKNLGALGDAGAIVCNDASLYDELAALHQYGWTERYRSVFPFGRNSRMDEIQAAILRVKLPLLDEWNAMRRDIFEIYASALAGGSCSPVNQTEAGPVVHLAVVRSLDRDRLAGYMASQRVGTAVHFPVLDCYQESQAALVSRSLGLATSEAAVEQILTVPLFPGMTKAEIGRVSAALAAFRTDGIG